MPTQCIKALISGRVQGVFFRDSTRRQALQWDISGQAINLRDGRVEVIACGEAESLQKLIDWLHHGPEYAEVSDVQVESIAPRDDSGFHIG